MALEGFAPFFVAVKAPGPIELLLVAFSAALGVGPAVVAAEIPVVPISMQNDRYTLIRILMLYVYTNIISHRYIFSPYLLWLLLLLGHILLLRCR